MLVEVVILMGFASIFICYLNELKLADKPVLVLFIPENVKFLPHPSKTLEFMIVAWLIDVDFSFFFQHSNPSRSVSDKTLPGFLSFTYNNIAASYFLFC